MLWHRPSFALIDEATANVAHEDVEKLFKPEVEKERFYLHIEAAAEAGWDFSSRWFINKVGENTGTLADTKTCYIVPLDLNALMYCKSKPHFEDSFRTSVGS